MAKHIHIHLGKTKDANGPAHAPAGSSKGGQFVAGGKTAGAHHAASKAHKAVMNTSEKSVTHGHHEASQHHMDAGHHLEQAAEYARNGKHELAKESQAEAENSSNAAEAAKKKYKAHLPAGNPEKIKQKVSPEAKKAALKRKAQRENEAFQAKMKARIAPPPSSSSDPIKLGNQAPSGGQTISTGKSHGSVR